MISLSKEKSTILKGFAILFVLLCHTNYLYNSGSWGVNLFLILSGYGLLSSYYANNNKDFFKNKFLKVYLPFLLVIIFQLLYLLVTTSFKVNPKVIIYSLLGLDFNYMYDKTMWYISFIFLNYLIFYILTFIITRFVKKQKYISIILIILEFIIGYIIWKGYGSCTVWNCGAAAFLYGFAFPIGLLLRFLSDIKINNKIKHIIYIVGLLLGCIVLLKYYKNVNNMDVYFVYGLSVPAIIVILSQYINFKYVKHLFIFLGKYSYYIYLWEGFILTNRFTWFSFAKNIHIINIISFTVIIIVSYLYGKIINKNIINKK